MAEIRSVHWNPPETKLKTACGRWLNTIRNWTEQPAATSCVSCRYTLAFRRAVNP